MSGEMGIHVTLTVACERIDPARWREVYAESLRVIEAFPAGAVDLAFREVAGVKVIVTTGELESEDAEGRRRWRICGDAQSKLRGETFTFPESLGAAHGDDSVGDDDILATAMGGYSLGRSVFSEKTQGRPYHVLIVAIGTLVENRFPRAALVGGDLGRGDGRAACELLERALGEHKRGSLY
jgi:hypothetical protein